MPPLRSGPGVGTAPGLRRARTAALAAPTATGTVLTAMFGAGVAAAAPPAFPDNLVVFPNRDFVTIEGFQHHIGETGTVEVRRGGQVVGPATATSLVVNRSPPRGGRSVTSGSSAPGRRPEQWSPSTAPTPTAPSVPSSPGPRRP